MGYAACGEGDDGHALRLKVLIKIADEILIEGICEECVPRLGTAWPLDCG